MGVTRSRPTCPREGPHHTQFSSPKLRLQWREPQGDMGGPFRGGALPYVVRHLVLQGAMLSSGRHEAHGASSVAMPCRWMGWCWYCLPGGLWLIPTLPAAVVLLTRGTFWSLRSIFEIFSNRERQNVDFLDKYAAGELVCRWGHQNFCHNAL